MTIAVPPAQTERATIGRSDLAADAASVPASGMYRFEIAAPADVILP